jgi:hypothetical protein
MRVWRTWWQWKKRKVCVKIVASGRKWSLPTPKANGRDVMYVCMYDSWSLNRCTPNVLTASFILIYINIFQLLCCSVNVNLWKQGVPKNDMSLMSLIFKNNARSLARRVTMCLSVKNCWHASKWWSISFLHWQFPSDGDFSFPRFVALLSLRISNKYGSLTRNKFLMKCYYFEITWCIFKILIAFEVSNWRLLIG